MKISIVIPAFNEERLLGETLKQINAARVGFARAGVESELIVCDNNSTDRTPQIAGDAGAMVVFESINQIGRARNTGAAAASGEWLLFVDADSHPSAELFSEVAEQIKSGECLAGGCTMRLEGHHPIADVVTRIWNWKSRFSRWVAGSFIFCETAVFRKLKGFNTEYFAGEELDLSNRLQEFARKDGRKIVILHRYPLVTSARKMHLYTWREHMRFLFRVALFQGRVLRDRNACHTWYDGRR